VDGAGIVDMTFTMRYTNFTTSTGYYTDEEKNVNSDTVRDLIDKGKLPAGADTDFDLRTVIYTKHPEVLTWT